MVDLPANVESCKCDSCSEGQCSIDLQGMSQQIDVLDLNCVKSQIGQKGKIADCIVLWRERNIAAVVELKGGQNISVKRLVRQLQGGLNVLAKLTDGQSVGKVYPILMYRTKKNLLPSIDKQRVRFGGQSKRIIAYPCGTKLTEIINQVSG